MTNRTKPGRLLCLLLCVLLLWGCAPASANRYSLTYLELFDTVITIVGYDSTEAAFRQKAEAIHQDLTRYHQLFDIYNDYEGMTNLKAVNDNAGIAPVQVDGAIIRLLLDCREYYRLTGGKVNAAMGSVLQLWHQARSDALADPQSARLPDSEALTQAAAHCSFDTIIIDEDASTVFITDPQQQLDVGAIAKGWATQRVAEAAPSGMLISVGGNVCATGPKADGSPWVIGIQDPEGGQDYLRRLGLSQGAAVTSGDYQRTYRVDGKDYHHIIDPATLQPATRWRSVTVVCGDSALADALSTALFLMDQTQGAQLAEDCGAQALWLDAEGHIFTTPDFPS